MECIHGLDESWCEYCIESRRKREIGRLFSQPYLSHVVVRDYYIKPPEVVEETQRPIKVEKPRCSRCHRRGANKGNRVFVRQPRIRDGYLGKGETMQNFPPTWEGPLDGKPRINLATHMVHDQWVCDRCCRGCSTCHNAPLERVEESRTRGERQPRLVSHTALFGTN